MDQKKIKTYYMYFIPITLLQSITTLLMITTFSVEDYGQMTLYLTNINLFFFLTLGIQLGYTLVLKPGFEADGFTNKINIFANLLAGFVTIINIILFTIFDYNTLLFLSILSAAQMIVFTVHKSILQTNFQIHKLNLYILAFRIIFVFDIIVYLITNQFSLMLITDLLLRIILSISGNIIIITSFNFTTINRQLFSDDNLRLVVKRGIPIMIGNWITMLYLLADKYVLRANTEALGYYSFAITIVLLIRVIVTPLKELIFVTMAKQDSDSPVTSNVKSSLLIGSVITIFAAGCAYIGFNYFDLFTKYQPAQTSLMLLLAIIPLSLALDLVLFNYSRIKSGKKFLIKTAASAIIMFGTLTSYTQLTTNFNLNVFSVIVLVNYFLIYLLFSYRSISSKSFYKYLVLMLALLLTYCSIIITVL